MKKLSSITQATKGELFGKDLINASDIINVITVNIDSSENIDYIIVNVDGNTIGTIKT